MRILKLLTDEKNLTNSFGIASPLYREIKKRWECDYKVIPKDMPQEECAELIREYDVLLTDWFSPKIPNELAENSGRLRYICNISGGIANVIDALLVESKSLTITNWGDAVGYPMGDATAQLLFMMLKDLPMCINATKRGLPRPPKRTEGVHTLYKTKVGIFGLGYIARRFIELISPFEPEIFAYDPYVTDFPQNVTMTESLEELFSTCEIISLHAGLTEETKGIITKELLARLPNGAIIINTARGDLVDQKALFDEILSGRIRGGLDVLAGSFGNEMPSDNHPIRCVDNAVLYGHTLGNGSWGKDKDKLTHVERNCLENLERFARGETPKFVIDIDRYKKMT